MTEKAQLKKLYKKIPEFKCIEGCTDCCGPVPISEYEAKKLGTSQRITPTTVGTCDCVYASKDGCTVYHDRPLICRLFGTVERLKCPHGKAPDKLLSSKQEDAILVQYLKL